MRSRAHTYTHTNTHFAYTSPRLPRLLETNSLTAGGPLPRSYLEPALGDTVHVCGGTSLLLTAQTPVEPFEESRYCFCRRFIFGRSECRSRAGAGAGSSHPPPQPSARLLSPGQWGGGGGVGGVEGGVGPGRPAVTLTVVVSETDGSQPVSSQGYQNNNNNMDGLSSDFTSASPFIARAPVSWPQVSQVYRKHTRN